MQMKDLVGKSIKIKKKAKSIPTTGFPLNSDGSMDYICGNIYTVIDYDSSDDSVCIKRDTCHDWPVFNDNKVWFIDKNWIKSVVIPAKEFFALGEK